MEEIGRGAEASIFREGSKVVKERLEKKYRHPEIDSKLRLSRTKREAKVFGKLEDLDFPAPRLIRKDKSVLEMNFIEGDKLRDRINENPEGFGLEIGKKIAVLHNNLIIHGDLTTSNMILNDEIYLIDFGLSFFSDKEEDKAVDIHILDESIESTHPEVHEEFMKFFLLSYGENSDDSKQILHRFELVKKRGRNKAK